MEALVRRVVVGNVGGVPGLLVPGQERLGAQFLEYSGADERGEQLLLDDPAELPATDTLPAAQVDDGSAADDLTWAGDLVPVRRVWARRRTAGCA